MNVLLLCTGNTCRSPMAEGILRKKIKEYKLDGIFVRSCGVYAENGAPANPKAIKVAMENGVSLSMFRAQRLTAQLIDWADVVICMTPSLCEFVKTKNVADFSLLYDIPPIKDPYGGTDEDYKMAYLSLDFACDLLIEDVVTGRLIQRINKVSLIRD